MGVYYNPVSDIENDLVGRALNMQDYGVGKSSLRDGEHLYALCDRFVFKQAVCVDSSDEYNEFFGQYTRGWLVSFTLYALSEEDHRKAFGRFSDQHH